MDSKALVLCTHVYLCKTFPLSYIEHYHDLFAEKRFQRVANVAKLLKENGKTIIAR